MSKTWTGQSAPYGQACMPCFKAKCKCILRCDGEQCERCHRLGRLCVPSDHIRRRRNQKGSSSKVAELEGRIDSLVAHLQDASHSPAAFAALTKKVSFTSNQESQVGDAASSKTKQYLGDGRNIAVKYFSTGAALTSLPSPNDEDDETIQATRGESQAASTAYPAIPGGSTTIELDLDISIEEQSTCLGKFRSKLLPSFPFINFPSDVSVDNLRSHQPFLLRAICTVATPSTEIKLSRGKRLKEVLCKELIIDGNPSIDLLLAILTFVSWSYEQFLAKKSASRLVMMAMSIVYELRLNTTQKKSYSLSEQPGFNQDDSTLKGAGEPISARGSEVAALDRNRAVLACFLLSSYVAAYYQQIEPMQWTSNLDESLHLLEANKACQNDVTLSLQIRLQLIYDKLKEIDGCQGSSLLAITHYLGALREQLRGIETSIPPSLPEAGALLAYCRFVEFRICEATSSTPPKDPMNNTPNLHRVNILSEHFQSLKRCFDCWLSMSPGFWAAFPLIYASQVAQCLFTLFTFATCEDLGWNFQPNETRAESLEIVNRLIATCDVASTEAGETADDDLWRQIGNKMVKYRAYIVARTAGNMPPLDMISPVDSPESLYGHGIVSTNLLFQAPAHGFYGTGEWMEKIFEGPFF